MSITYAAAALALARRGALAQQLNAIESLASVDMICIDKTGTLTEPRLRVARVAPRRRASTRSGSRDALGRFAASAATATRRWPRSPAPCRRRRSGRRDGAVLVAAALERPAARRHALRPRRARAVPARPARGRGRAQAQAAGRRVVAFGTTTGAFPGRADRRSAAARAARARRAGRGAAAGRARDGRASSRRGRRAEGALGRRIRRRSARSPPTPAIPVASDAARRPRAAGGRRELARVAPRRATVIGRISPEGKRRVVEALRDRAATSRWSATASTTCPR